MASTPEGKLQDEVKKYLESKGAITYKNLPDFEGYAVTNTGIVLSLPKDVEFINRWGQLTTRRTKLKQLVPDINHGGYQMVRIGKSGKQIHRLVASAYLGLDYSDKTLEVHHKDRIRTNNNVDNLEVLPKTLHLQDNLRTDILRKPVRVTFDDGNELLFDSVNDVISHFQNVSTASIQKLLKGGTISRGILSSIRSMVYL
jgi:hypothetical protein